MAKRIGNRSKKSVKSRAKVKRKAARRHRVRHQRASGRR